MSTSGDDASASAAAENTAASPAADVEVTPAPEAPVAADSTAAAAEDPLAPPDASDAAQMAHDNAVVGDEPDQPAEEDDSNVGSSTPTGIAEATAEGEQETAATEAINATNSDAAGVQGDADGAASAETTANDAADADTANGSTADDGAASAETTADDGTAPNEAATADTSADAAAGDGASADATEGDRPASHSTTAMATAPGIATKAADGPADGSPPDMPASTEEDTVAAVADAATEPAPDAKNDTAPPVAPDLSNNVSAAHAHPPLEPVEPPAAAGKLSDSGAARTDSPAKTAAAPGVDNTAARSAQHAGTPVAPAPLFVRRELPPSRIRGRYIVQSGRRKGREIPEERMQASVQRLFEGSNGKPPEPIDMNLMQTMRARQRAMMVGGGRTLTEAERTATSERLYTTKLERPQTAPPRAVRVKHVRTQEGLWVDQLIPARVLSPEKQGEVLTTMYQRGIEDATKRDTALAAKYLRPLTAYGRIVYSPKQPKPPAEGGVTYMTKEMTRVTPPLKGTSVYPDDNWQLPG